MRVTLRIRQHTLAYASKRQDTLPAQVQHPLQQSCNHHLLLKMPLFARAPLWVD
jgi:hypothetical protein